MPALLGSMTLPFRGFAFARAIEGVAEAGFRATCIGLPHDGRLVPHPDDSDEQVQTVVRDCRAAGLEPVMLFCLAHAEHDSGPAGWMKSIRHAAATGIRFILGVGTWSYRDPHPRADSGRKPHEELALDERRWIEAMKPICEAADRAGITVLIKPHTGNTATAFECRQALQAVATSNLAVCYDCGNVRFYEGVDPLADLPLVANRVAGLCLKDHAGPRFHMDFPPPGEGAIDHVAVFRILRDNAFAGPMMIERVDGTADAARMSYEETVARLTRAREHMEKAAAAAGLPLSLSTVDNT